VGARSLRRRNRDSLFPFHCEKRKVIKGLRKELSEKLAQLVQAHNRQHVVGIQRPRHHPRVTNIKLEQ